MPPLCRSDWLQDRRIRARQANHCALSGQLAGHIETSNPTIGASLDNQIISRRWLFKPSTRGGVIGPDIQAPVEEYLAVLPEDNWHSLCARVRLLD
jgi:hypothetical protein